MQSSIWNTSSEIYPSEVTLPSNLSNYTIPPFTDDGNLDLSNAGWDKNTRITVLWLEIIIGTVGGIMVCMWLWCNRSRKSRVNVIMLHVTLSDLLVMVATLIQVVWEMADRWWLAGGAMCRIVKFYQSFSMMSSSNMLVLLSIDRHQAIRSPLGSPFAVWKMALPCWSLAALLSTPMFFMYRVTFMDDPTNQFFNMTICESVLRVKPPIHRMIFTSSMAVIHIFIPCIIIAVSYVRIFLKISEKATTSTSSHHRQPKPGKIHLQSTKSSSLPRARVKSLKMTVVIVSVFLICGLPYHVLELIYNFGDYRKLSNVISAILGALPVLNAVFNPYIFLLFSATCYCAKRVVRPNCQRASAGSRLEHSYNTNAHNTKSTALMSSVQNVDFPGNRSLRQSGLGKESNLYLPMIDITCHNEYSVVKC